MDAKNEYAYETMGQIEIQREKYEEAVVYFDKVGREDVQRGGAKGVIPLPHFSGEGVIPLSSCLKSENCYKFLNPP